MIPTIFHLQRLASYGVAFHSLHRTPSRHRQRASSEYHPRDAVEPREGRGAEDFRADQSGVGEGQGEGKADRAAQGPDRGRSRCTGLPRAGVERGVVRGQADCRITLPV
jgi:hypothetical protein